jgi:7-cyano-7-deazaguanine synthase
MAEIIGNRVELTFVPLRNMLFFTIAANRAVALGCFDIVTGICQQDNANYPDCREDFRVALERAVNRSLGLATHDYQKAARFQIHAPLMNMSKKESVLLAREIPGCWEALAYSHTSYAGDYPPVDANHASVLRAQGFAEAGFPDPLVLRAWKEGLMELPDSPNYQGVSRDEK